ncbi:Uncharacterised protein [uncultured archaeon]|nr:Uncharacterised protein [uncultured archaeon]
MKKPLTPREALIQLGLLEKVSKFDTKIYNEETALVKLMLDKEISPEQYVQYRDLTYTGETIFDSMWWKYSARKKKSRELKLPEEFLQI